MKTSQPVCSYKLRGKAGVNSKAIRVTSVTPRQRRSSRAEKTPDLLQYSKN
jgi:hypothetical protein